VSAVTVKSDRAPFSIIVTSSTVNPDGTSENVNVIVEVSPILKAVPLNPISTVGLSVSTV